MSWRAHIDDVRLATLTPTERANCFEFFQEWIAERIIRGGDNVVDVGASVGGHTWSFLQLVGQEGRVIAFEPSPNLNANLKRWCDIYPNLSLLDFALSNEDAEVEFHVPVGDQGNGSLWRQHAQGVEVETTIKVPVTTLDKVVASMELEKLRLVKVDVEGSEFLFLEGAQETLRAYKPWILIEVVWSFSPTQIESRGACETANWNRLCGVLKRTSYEAFTLFGEELSAPDVNHDVILLAPAGEGAGKLLAEEAGEMLDAFKKLDGSWTLVSKFDEKSPAYGRLARAWMHSPAGRPGSLYDRDRLEEYVANLPLLHTWDNGETWNSGGFGAEHLLPLFDFVSREIGSGAAILETGSGNSTILFLHLDPEKVVSICPDPKLFDRIENYCRMHRISLGPAEFIDGFSEWELPRLAELGRSEPLFDFALIDGHHGWPNVFVDFFFTNYLVKPDGFIMIDDIQLHSVAELMHLLDRQPGFVRVLDLGKAIVYRRTASERILPDWVHQPYIAEKSR
jgi:FkbM family methyltransferase